MIPDRMQREMSKNQKMVQSMWMKNMKVRPSKNYTPFEMCEKMQESMDQIAKTTDSPDPEVEAMFEEWSFEVEQEILKEIKEQRDSDISSISNKLGISEDSTLYFIKKLIRDKKIDMKEIKQ